MSGPPILPMYKANAQKRRSTGPSKENVAIIIFSTFIAVFFFVSIYFGSKYLQDHIEDENWASKLGVPNTRSIIKKWSVNHLGGIDLTELGPPHPIQKRSTGVTQPPLLSTRINTQGNVAVTDIDIDNATDINSS